MRCVFPNCETDSSSSCQEVSLFKFPTEASLRASWLAVLRRAGGRARGSERGAVCSRHFSPHDVLLACGGLRVLAPGAVPFHAHTSGGNSAANQDVQVCRICLSAESRLYPLAAHRLLRAAYETLTGLLVADEGGGEGSGEGGGGRMPRGVCAGCARRLLGCEQLRAASLRAHRLLTDILARQRRITLESLQPYIGHSFLAGDADVDIHLEEQEEELDSGSDDGDERPPTSPPPPSPPAGPPEDMSVHFIKVEEDTIQRVAHNLTQPIKQEEDADSPPRAAQGAAIKVEHVETDLCSNEETSDDYMRGDCAGGDTWDGSVPFASVLQDRFPCERCGYQATTAARLASHLRAHSAARSFSCHLCSYKTTHRGNLNHHLKVHSGDKPHACRMCRATFGTTGQLRKHMQIHSSEKPHSCHICKSSFVRESDLRRHLTIHSGEKPFSCYVCNKAYKGKVHLKAHLKTHTGEKPYSCPDCKKSFNDRSNLQKHLKTHAKEKPLVCHVCDKTFIEKECLEAHFRIHCGEKPFS